jgi:hypothetical protein
LTLMQSISSLSHTGVPSTEYTCCSGSCTQQWQAQQISPRCSNQSCSNSVSCNNDHCCAAC